MKLPLFLAPFILSIQLCQAACTDRIYGTAPFCGGRETDCLRGYQFDGYVNDGCWFGSKVKCKCISPNCDPCQDYLVGQAPFCAGGNANCRRGWERAGRVKDNCFSGSKTRCRCAIDCLPSPFLARDETNDEL